MIQTLKDSEMRYRRLFEAAQDGILILNAGTGEIEDVNPYLMDMLGYSYEEFIQKKLWNLGAFKDIVASEDAFMRLQINKTIRYEDLPLKTKDGRLIRVEFVSNVYAVGDQQVVQCNLRDITERRWAQQSASESQERYRAVLNNMMEGCRIFDYDWRYIYVNNTTAKHERKTPVELLMHTLMEVYPGIENTPLFSTLQISMEDRVRQRIETQFFYADGSFAWFELSIQPVPEGIFVLSIDITERKQAEEMQAKLAAIVAFSDDGIFSTRDWFITSWNHGAEQLYGYAASEIIGQSITLLIPEDRTDEFTEIIAKMSRGESVKNFETVRLHKDGTGVDVSLTISPIRDTLGQLQGTSVITRDITERKRAEEMQANLAAIVASSEDAIFSSRDGVLTSWNRGAERLYGYRAEEIIGRLILVLVPRELWGESSEIVKRVALGESVKNFETVRLRKDGTSFNVSLTVSPIRDAAGRLHGASTIARDITERKRAEEMQAKLAAIVESSDEAIIGTTPERIITSWNLGAQRLYEYSANEVIGKSTAFLIPPDRLDELVKIHQKVLNGESFSHIETARLRKDGVRLTISLTVSPIKDVSGRVIGVAAISHDISERKVREALRARLSAIVESSDDAIIGKTLDGIVTSWNRGAENLYEYSADEVIGQPISLLIPPDRPDELPEILIQLKRGESIQHFETVRVRKDGMLLDISLTISPIKNASGEVIGASTIAHDITERKRTENALRVNQERLTLALAATRTGVWERNDLTHQVYWSPECYQVTGVDPSTKKPLEALFTLIHPDDLNRVITSIQQALQQREQFNVEFRIIDPSGELRWLQNIGRAEYDVNGQPLRTIGTVSDVTERKRSEELIRESDNRFRALLQNSADAITLLDPSGVVIYDSPAAPGILGYAPEEWLGQNVIELIHPDDLLEVRTLFGTLTHKAASRLNSIFRVRHKNRFWVWIEAVATNLLDQPGVNAIVLNYRDITNRKQADEKLRSTREFLQSVQDALSTHIAILDHNGVIVQVNAAWRDFGQQNGLLSPDYCVGVNYLEVCDNAKGEFSEQGKLMADAIRNVFKSTQMEISLEYPCHAPTEQRWFLARITCFENDGSKWLVVAHTNITERKLVEVEVAQRLSELEVLYQSGLAFSNLLDAKKIAQKMIDLLAHKMHWYHTTIRLYHAESESLQILAFNMPHLINSKERNAAKKRLMKIHHSNQGLSGWVIQHGELLCINDLQNDARYFETFPGLQSGLYVPIKVGEHVLGVITIESEYLHAFQKSDERLVETLAAQVAIALQNAQLFEQLTRSNLDLVSAYNATIEGWSRALDLRDKETEGHSLRVTEMSLKLARAIGLNEDDLAQIRWGALLHDIGKMGIPDGILLKPGPLTDDEWAIMRKHPAFAYEMLLPIQYLHRALDIPYCHHEKWDGSGYPRGLKGEQIPLAARIFSVVDVWDALKSDRPYRAGWEDQKVRDHLRASAGTHFAPNIVEVFLKILE